MASIRFNLKPAAGKKLQIRALFQDGKIQKYKNTGYTIPDAKLKDEYRYWDANKHLVRNHESAGTINALLHKWTQLFTAYKDECKRNDELVSVDGFIKMLDGKKDLGPNPSLVDVFEEFLKAIKPTHDNATVKGYKVIKGKIEKFEKHAGRKYLVSEVDKSFYKDLSVFLMEEEGNTNATISRRMGKITTVLSFGIDFLKLKTVNAEYKKVYKLKVSKAAKFPLRPDELATLRAFKADTRMRQVIVDAFLFACETGLRFSDIKQLQPSHIQTQINEGGIIKFVRLTAMKTDVVNSMPLSNVAIDIFEKYQDCNPVFDFRSHKVRVKGVGYSQAVSKILKDIFKELELNRPCEIIKMQGAKTLREMKPLHEVISFHMARNTYITRLLSSNLAPAFVKDNVGHSDISVTMGYFRNDDVSRWKETLKVLNN